MCLEFHNIITINSFLTIIDKNQRWKHEFKYYTHILPIVISLKSEAHGNKRKTRNITNLLFTMYPKIYVLPLHNSLLKNSLVCVTFRITIFFSLYHVGKY